MRKDEITSKREMHLVRQESFASKDNDHMKDVMRRVFENNEISTAKINNARRKS